jgi:Putative transposase/Transposase zinc-binding domain
MKPAFEVAEILEKHWTKVQNLGLNTWQYRTLDALKRCRTASLGGHIDACDVCGHLTLSYNSCRNRHCNKCQGEKREDWIIARETELLPVPYFHLVFTLPSELNQVALYEPKILYDILFKVSWEVMEAFSRDPKHLDAQGGMIAILHTWGQNLSLHPHLHCIVPGGGVDKNGNWKYAKNKGKFLYPVKAMAKVFRGKFVAELRKQLVLDQRLYNGLFMKDWRFVATIVYAKRPFGNPKAVIEYLGRYTHKVAISNHRIKSIDNQTVSFTYKDYKDESKVKLMTLTHQEFIRRFAQHILPKRFVRIRHYGILSRRGRPVVEAVKTGRFADKIGTYTCPEGSKSSKNKCLSLLQEGENGDDFGI